MTTFGLVHGAGTVGASWAPVAAVLEAHGHRCVAPDLPMEDPAATFSAYAQVVLDRLADAGDDVVLAGHSMGGMVVPLVAAQRPVRACVYVAAMVPIPGQRLVDVMRDEPMVTAEASAAMVRGDDGLIRWDHDGAQALLFDELPPERAQQAWSTLRAHAVAPYREQCPLTAFPEVAATYVPCAEDRVISPSWGRDTGAQRLRATVVELAGGHMPMLTRPRELAALLERLAGAAPEAAG